MAKILVTGGAGFIGSHVVDRLVCEGHQVVVVDNLSTGFKENLNREAKFHKMDIRDEKIETLFKKEKFEFVNHHAAQMDVRRSTREPEFDAEVNILGSLNLILNSVKYNVKKFIYASTGGAIYGEAEYLPVDEKHPVNPISQYGISKHTVEHYLYLYRELYGFNYTALRYPNVFGPRQNPEINEAGVNSIFINAMLKGKTPTIFGSGEQLRDYTYIDDIVEANMLAFEKGNGEILNIGTGIGTSVNKIYKMLDKMLDFKEKPIYAAPRKGEIGRIYLDATKAKDVLGWEAKVSFEEGLKKTVEWWREKSG
jgi:UDP-glucose 4-epimerase